jgi:hypothetical protein
MLCLWPPTFNHVRRSLDGFTSMTAPIRGAVRAPFRSSGSFSVDGKLGEKSPVGWKAADR